ncbi:MAG TPA: hypothetical protein VGO00_15245, partial [Kofleriaceae bacterium]|nr:hypothetical protein [Kofleriaceae bacterium]
MSSSRSRSGSRSGSRPSSSSDRSPDKQAAPAITAANAPWIRDGIDYGPARAAIHDLASWALDIADEAVHDWPAGRAHVRNTRRLVEARIDGGHARRVSIDDVMFTARLLARIFDDDLGLDLSEALTIFDLLELPSEVVPVPSSRRRQASDGAAALRTLTRMSSLAHPTSVPPLRFC